jgi:hypothetical protein
MVHITLERKRRVKEMYSHFYSNCYTRRPPGDEERKTGKGGLADMSPETDFTKVRRLGKKDICTGHSDV